MQRLTNSFHTTSVSLLSISLITHACIITALVLTSLSLSSNTWLVTSNKQSQEYGLLGYENTDSYSGDSEFIHYTQFYKTDKLMYTLRIAGYVIFTVLTISAVHNLVTLVLCALTWPLQIFSSHTTKKYALIVAGLSAAVQLGVLLTWYFVTTTQRNASKHTSFSTGYYYEVLAFLLTLLSLPLLNYIYNQYDEYSYLPLVDDNYDSRDVLYPLRQQQKQQQQHYQ